MTITADTTPLDLTHRIAFINGTSTPRKVNAVDGSLLYLVSSPADARSIDSVITLPLIGETVEILSESGVINGVWLGLNEDAEQLDGLVTVLLMSGPRVASFAFPPAQVEARKVVTEKAPTGEQHALAAMLREAREHSRTKRKHQEYVAHLVSEAHEYADEHELCSHFDDFMTSHGLPDRSRDFTAEVTITTTLLITRSARNFDDAVREISDSDVIAALTVSNVQWDAEEE